MSASSESVGEGVEDRLELNDFLQGELSQETFYGNTQSDTTRCLHLSTVFEDEVEKNNILDKYTAVISWNARRSRQLSRPLKRRKLSAPTCNTCGLMLSRPLVCLHCSYAGCWSDCHILAHLKEADHLFCVDVKSGSIFCSHCDDFIYDTTLEEVFKSILISVEEELMELKVINIPREPFRPWIPSEEEIVALDETPTICCQGRRGLLNLGQTCFFNVVLQSLLHNPLLRNYFLSDKHNHKLCKLKDCTCCEMDKLFAEIYSETPGPFGPTSFLATTWRASAELSGYAQQDAHEFFMAALNQIHGTCRGSTNVSCNCIIHSTFAGQLQSDVTCERCGNVTSTVDPMLDISLELKGKGGEIVSVENTLAGCLRRFTQPEKLGSKEYSCSRCTKASHEASKRLSIRKLPPVLSFQFKRFEHKNSDKSSAQKIDAPVRFPLLLDMSPYTTQAMNPRGKNGTSFHGPDSMYEYELFAVIIHEGQMDNGHYTNFARFQDEWYRFDDERVTHTNLEACLDSPAYMCFYVKRHLDYKPYVTPSYRLTRENEAVRELELEREKEAARIKEVDDALLAML